MEGVVPVVIPSPYMQLIAAAANDDTSTSVNGAVSVGQTLRPETCDPEPPVPPPEPPPPEPPPPVPTSLSSLVAPMPESDQSLDPLPLVARTCT